MSNLTHLAVKSEEDLLALAVLAGLSNAIKGGLITVDQAVRISDDIDTINDRIADDGEGTIDLNLEMMEKFTHDGE